MVGFEHVSKNLLRSMATSCTYHLWHCARITPSWAQLLWSGCVRDCSKTCHWISAQAQNGSSRNKKRGPNRSSSHVCFASPNSPNTRLHPPIVRPAELRPREWPLSSSQSTAKLAAPTGLELLTLAIWAERVAAGAFARFVAGQDLFPFLLVDLARLLVNHYRTCLVDDGDLREFLSMERLGNLFAVIGRHVDVTKPIRAEQLGRFAARTIFA